MSAVLITHHFLSVRDMSEGIGCYSIAQFFILESTGRPSLEIRKMEFCSKIIERI